MKKTKYPSQIGGNSGGPSRMDVTYLGNQNRFPNVRNSRCKISQRTEYLPYYKMNSHSKEYKKIYKEFTKLGANILEDNYKGNNWWEFAHWDKDYQNDPENRLANIDFWYRDGNMAEQLREERERLESDVLAEYTDMELLKGKW